VIWVVVIEMYADCGFYLRIIYYLVVNYSMAWKKISTTIGQGYYPGQIGELFDDFSSSVSYREKDHLRVSEGKNSLKLDSYVNKGIDVAAEMDINETQFRSVCSALPDMLSGVKTYEAEKEYRRMELNLGRILKDDAGQEVARFVDHVAYQPYSHNYLISVVHPENVKKRIEKYGKGSSIDNTLPEASIALRIADASIKEGLIGPEQTYDCTKPVCPRKEVDKEELIEYIKRSPSVKLEGSYLKGGKVFHDSERVLIDMTPAHITLDGLSDIEPEFNSRRVLYPLLKSTEFEFGPEAKIEFKEACAGRLKSGYNRLKNIRSDKGQVGRIYRAGESTAEIGLGVIMAPFAVAHLIGDSLYYCTIGPYMDERKQRKNFYERVLTKGITRPDGDGAECVCVLDKSCINRKYEEKKKAGTLPKEEK